MDKATIDRFITESKNWKYQNKALEKEFVFKDFYEAIKFVNKVAEIAELRQHHPDIKILYNKVCLSTYSHETGEISDSDFELVTALDLIKV